MLSTTRIVISTLAVLLMSLGDVSVTYAQGTGIAQLPMGGSIDMSMPLYKSRIVTVEQPTGRVAVGNPDVADIVVISPTQLYVLAKDIGTTNLLFWGRDNRLLGSVNLEVAHDLDGLKSKLHQLMPNEAIEVYSAQRSIILKGRASNVVVMNAAVRIAEGYLAQIQTAKKAQQFEQDEQSRREDKSVGSVINLIEIGGSQQVMLQVKVAEIKRTEMKRLSMNFTALWFGSDGTLGAVNGGGTMGPDGDFLPNPFRIINQGFFGTFVDDNFRFNLALDAAKENGLAKILAEPTLVARSGQKANFLAGGEVPLLQPSGLGTVSVELKPFGVGVEFLPTVLGPDRIHLEITPEVSEPDDSLGIQVNGIFVPGFTTRRATTAIELGDGQSFAVAGLLQDKVKSVVDKVPGLGDVPILGALFRSQEFQRDETELVIIVTPHLVKPLDPGHRPLPTDHYAAPGDVDFFALGRSESRKRHSHEEAKNLSPAQQRALPKE